MKRLNSTPAENSLLTCEICQEKYNLSDKVPTMVNCCMETLCLSCWRSGFEGGFTCPFKCGKPTEENPQQPIMSRGVYKIVEKSITLKIQCSEHSDKSITKFDSEAQRFKCSQCPVGDSDQEIAQKDIKDALQEVE